MVSCDVQQEMSPKGNYLDFFYFEGSSSFFFFIEEGIS